MFTYDEAYNLSLEYFGGDELAAKVFIDKYALRDVDGNLEESTPRDMHWRISRELARVERKKYGSGAMSEEEIFEYLDGFKKIIPQGSPMYAIGNYVQFSSVGNCFVIDSPADSYGAILKADQELVQISKRRGGVGVDISRIRPAGHRTANAARSSTGIVPFMDRYSASIREVGQDGRRGALLVSCCVHHPQILDFVTAKQDQTKVTGANISVRLSDEFLKAVKDNTDYEQRWPVDSPTPQVSRMVNARSIWMKIIELAHATAEPGLLFWDTIKRESPADCYDDFQTISTNPCCLSTNQSYLVRTDAGLVEIKDVTKDDLVWINDEKQWARTEGYIEQGIALTYKIILKNNIEFIATGNHKFKKSNGLLTNVWELWPGDKLEAENGDPIEILSVEPHGECEVGCLIVPGHGRFTVNGIISGNSELPLSSNDACRLLLLNLFGYVVNPYTDEAYFNFEQFYQDAQIAQRFMDDITDLELEAIDRILRKVEKDPESDEIKQVELDLWRRIRKSCEVGRRTGTGITALGDTLAAIGIQYGSEASIRVTEEIYKTLKLGCYRSSVDMAKKLGPFLVWDYEKEKDNPFLLRIADEDPQLYSDMKEYGRRNISLLTTAPAGSVSIMAQTSSGIEPVFMLNYTRRKKINPSDAGTRVDFVDQNGDKWQEFTVYHPKFKTWMEVTGKSKVEDSPYYKSCAEEIDWTQRVRLQALANRHLDHSISSTLNVPEDATVEQVAEIYETAWEAGCKGITVYRKNCRTGVLVENKTDAGVNDSKSITKTVAVKRPKDLRCDVYHATAGGKKFFVLVGLLGEEPYEVIAGEHTLPRSIDHGVCTKIKKGTYRLLDDDGEVILENAVDHCSDDQEALLRMVSTSLRHGADIQFVVEQLEKTRGNLYSFAKMLARNLKRYIPDDTPVSGAACPECDLESLVRQEGCVTCSNCGYSKCG